MEALVAIVLAGREASESCGHQRLVIFWNFQQGRVVGSSSLWPDVISQFWWKWKFFCAHSFVCLVSYSVLDKAGEAKVLGRYALVSILEIKAEKEHLIMKKKNKQNILNPVLTFEETQLQQLHCGESFTNKLTLKDLRIISRAFSLFKSFLQFKKNTISLPLICRKFSEFLIEKLFIAITRKMDQKRDFII